MSRALITVETRYYAFLREKTGARSERFRLEEGATVRTLVDMIVKKYGDELGRYILTEQGELRPSVAVAINGVKITGAPLDHRLSEGDVVVIIPPISGGLSLKLPEGLQVHGSVGPVDIDY